MSQSARLQAPLIACFVLLLAIAASSIWLYFAADKLNGDVALSVQIRSAANSVLLMTQDAETGQRGFLLTHNQAYLVPYSAGTEAIPAALSRLQGAVVDSASEAKMVARLRELVDEKLGELASTLAPAKKGDFAAALAIVNNDSGNNLMRDIRAEVARINASEEKTRAVAATWANRTNILLAFVVTAAVIAVILLAAYSVRTTRRATESLIEAQHDLENVNHNLEKIVEARVGDLRVANEEVTRFAYIVSHDLRAPLVNVLGFTTELNGLQREMKTFLSEVEGKAPDLVTTVRRDWIETDLPEALGFIRSSTQKMDRLINAILKLSREGRRTLKPETIALATLVKAQSDSLSQQLASKQAEILIENGLPDLVSDRLAIEQIFGNLIENAVKYLMPGRPGKVVVDGRRDGAFLRYRIIDNGRGIVPKDRERIFELFRRSGEQDTQGEGIGLTFVRNLVKRLGGSIAVESDLGAGSTFVLTFPAVFTTQSAVDF